MRISVFGAGTWGTALARRLFLNGHDVTLYSHREESLQKMMESHRHENLGNAVIPTIPTTSFIREAASHRSILVLAVSSLYIRSTVKKILLDADPGTILVDAAKGMEKDTLYTMTEVMEDVRRHLRPKDFYPLVTLSGPTHAEEVALDLPTTVVSASRDQQAAKTVQDAFMHPCFRVYTNSDIFGVELCGALKNIVALAAGISDGLGFGDNAKAALITRGMSEITRLGLRMGAQKETFMGLAGFGDLIVTATSEHSRNHQCGLFIGQGIPVLEAVQKVGQVVEGMNALPAAKELSEKYEVEMPIVDAMTRVIQGADVRQTVLQLMTREKKTEWGEFGV